MKPNIMVETIIGRFKKAKPYSIICDEASNASKKRQLLFWFRYVNDYGDICEDILKFILCKSGFAGKDLYNEVTETLRGFCLVLQNCRGQGYGGAVAVSGYVNGRSA